MIITKKQLSRLIRRAVLSESALVPLRPFSEGYMVPEFDNTESMQIFLDELEPDEEVEQDVIDPETGDVFLYAGESPMDSEWFVPEEPEAEVEEEEEDSWDWDAWEREREAEIQAKQDAYEKVLDKTTKYAVEAGKDWAMDTMHDAVANPGMWQSGGMTRADSPEEYVLGFGQDAAGDIADGIVGYSMDRETQAVIDDLPSEKMAGMGTYGSSFMRDDAGRPSKQLFKEIIADHVYDGIAKGVEEFKKREGME